MKPLILAAVLLAMPAVARDLDFADRHPLAMHDGRLTTDPFAVPGEVHELSADDQPPRDRLSLLTLAAFLLRQLHDAR